MRAGPLSVCDGCTLEIHVKFEDLTRLVCFHTRTCIHLHSLPILNLLMELMERKVVLTGTSVAQPSRSLKLPGDAGARTSKPARLAAEIPLEVMFSSGFHKRRAVTLGQGQATIDAARVTVLGNRTLLTCILAFVGCVSLMTKRQFTVNRLVAACIREEERLWWTVEARNVGVGNKSGKRTLGVGNKEGTIDISLVVAIVRRKAYIVRRVALVGVNLRTQEGNFIDFLAYLQPPRLHALSLIGCDLPYGILPRVPLIKTLGEFRCDAYLFETGDDFMQSALKDGFSRSCLVTLDGATKGCCPDCGIACRVRTCDCCGTSSTIDDFACYVDEKNVKAFHNVDFVATCRACGLSLCVACFQQWNCQLGRRQNPSHVPVIAPCPQCDVQFKLATVAFCRRQEDGPWWNEQTTCEACNESVCKFHEFDCTLCGKGACRLCQEPETPSETWPEEERQHFQWWCTECQKTALLHSSTSIADLVARVLAADRMDEDDEPVFSCDMLCKTPRDAQVVKIKST
jgi:hypothetical protein